MRYLLLLLFLVSCAVPTATQITNMQPVITTSTITWVTYKDEYDVELACKKLGVSTRLFDEIHACATFNLTEKTCTIHSVVPLTFSDPALSYIGHETVHCFSGNFHN